MDKLTEKTLIPLGVALSLIGGGAAWLTKLAFQTSANAATLEQIATKQDVYTDHIAAIRQDLAVIRVEIQQIKKEKTNGTR